MLPIILAHDIWYCFWSIVKTCSSGQKRAAFPDTQISRGHCCYWLKGFVPNCNGGLTGKLVLAVSFFYIHFSETLVNFNHRNMSNSHIALSMLSNYSYISNLIPFLCTMNFWETYLFLNIKQSLYLWKKLKCYYRQYNRWI